jgi:hypothetical protein
MLSSPKVDGVRLATMEDLHRISIVAAAAFFWSPTFRFQRPRYREYPMDTIASYCREYEAAMKDPDCVVLVAEDTLDLEEVEHVYKALRGAWSLQSAKKKDVVAVCSLNLKLKSSYVGQFQPQGQQVSTINRPSQNH